MRNADMLHHADRDHAIERAFDIAIIQFAEFHQIADTGGLRPLLGDPDLFGRDIDADNTGAGLLGEVNGKAAPAGADLDHAHPRRQLQFGGGMKQLVALRLFQRVIRGIAEIAAGILHVLVEKETVQLGGKIVVMAGLLGAMPVGLA